MPVSAASVRAAVDSIRADGKQTPPAAQPAGEVKQTACVSIHLQADAD